MVPRDSDISAFVKAEKINLTEKPDPAPRIIQPRDPRYNVEVGCYLKHTEKIMMKAIDQLFNPDSDIQTVFKGLTADQSGRMMRRKWLKFRDPVALGLDASRFDQHVSRQALEWEHA